MDYGISVPIWESALIMAAKLLKLKVVLISHFLLCCQPSSFGRCLITDRDGWKRCIPVNEEENCSQISRDTNCIHRELTHPNGWLLNCVLHDPAAKLN